MSTSYACIPKTSCQLSLHSEGQIDFLARGYITLVSRKGWVTGPLFTHSMHRKGWVIGPLFLHIPRAYLGTYFHCCKPSVLCILTSITCRDTHASIDPILYVPSYGRTFRPPIEDHLSIKDKFATFVLLTDSSSASFSF